MNLSPEAYLTISRITVFVLAIALVILVVQIRDSMRHKRTVRAILRLGTARRSTFKAMHSVRGGSTPGGTDEYVVTLLKGSTDDMDRVATLLLAEIPRRMHSEVRL